MKLNYIFKIGEYSKAYDYAIENGYTIKEIDPDKNGRRFQIVEFSKPSEAELARLRIAELKAWFDNFYAKEEQKLRRLRTLAKKCDDGADPYEALLTLYDTAELKRAEIQKLEEVAHGD